MRPFGALLALAEAKEIVDSNIQPITRVEVVKLDSAVGRVLAADLVATLSVPGFDRAAMDGYAVRAEDTFGAGQFKPRVLEVLGQVNAGDVPGTAVSADKCLQISTGAMMPKGADAVVMVEDTELDGGHVKVFKSITPRSNVGKVGEDINEGAPVLRSGTLLDAGKIGVLASQGMTRVEVYEKPKVAVLPSGEEVVPVGKKLRRGQLYDINSHTVSAVVMANGGIPVPFDVVGDRADVIRGSLSEAVKNDLVIISGGSSVGERDLIMGVIQGWGKVLFHGIQVRPGKPTLFAMVEGKPLLGMPGYPTSCLMNSYLFVLPVVRKMAHLPPRAGQTITARLARRVTGSVGRRQFLTVRVENGQAVSAFKESGAITSIANADGYIEIPENVDNLEAGEMVTVTLF
jgi:molybdenum cofactor synthesis domain-containing protein